MKRLFLAIALIATPASAGQDSSRAILVADLLARIDEGSAHPKSGTLARDLRTLDRLGAHPAAGSEDPSIEWRKAAHISQEPDYRGRVLGPAYSRGWIEPGQTARIDQQFLAGQRATVAISSAPGGTLALSVIDPDRLTVCVAQPRSCAWLPRYTQRYTITLSNPGPKRLRFYLVVD